MTNAEPDTSSGTPSGPTLAGERNPVIDILRGFALFGILLVNFPGSEAGRSGAADDAVRRLLSILVSGKFYTTFSFLFGLGFALQLLRARSRGRRVVPLYIRRMLGLFLIGLGHAILIWQGDVLLVYAFMGLFLIPFRNCPARVLLPLAVLVLAGEFFLSISERPFVVQDLVPRITNPEIEQNSELQDALAYNEIRDAAQRLWAACKSGTYLQAVVARFEVWRLSNRYTFRYIWVTSFAMFLTGLVAGRYGLIRYPPARSVLIQRVMWVALPVWLLLGILTTYGPQVLGAFYYKIHWKVITLAWVLHAPAGSLFYVSAILTLLAARPQWIARLASLGAVGRMALSNYLLQSVIGTLLYYGYGLGLEAKLGMLSGFLVAMAVFILQIVWSRWWLGHFQFGPCEWVWRLFTYSRVPPMRLVG
jgi:uncharacterized protein